MSCLLIGPTLFLYIFVCRLVPFKIIFNCHISSQYVKIVNKINSVLLLRTSAWTGKRDGAKLCGLQHKESTARSVPIWWFSFPVSSSTVNQVKRRCMYLQNFSFLLLVPHALSKSLIISKSSYLLFLCFTVKSVITVTNSFMKICVLVLAGIELIFSMIAGVGVWFGFVLETV